MGPKKIIDLDQTKESSWKVDEDALHLYMARLWRIEKNGCMVCIKNGLTGPKATTLRSEDSREFVCLTHGALVEVPFKIVRTYTVTLGHLHSKGEEKFEDSVLVPKSVSEEEKNGLLKELLDEIEQEDKSTPVVV